MWKLQSPAKINIFLEITGKKNNLHCLHSLFCKVTLHDVITITPSTELKVAYNNTQIENDIIIKTVLTLRKHFPQINTDFSFEITKNIPVGAGLGGGSSNAATVLKFLLEQNKINVSIQKLGQIAQEIGSDVPFFLHEQSMILHGASAELSKPLYKIPALYCVITHPQLHLLTQDVFAKINPPYTSFRATLNFNDAISRTNEMQTPANLLTQGIVGNTLNTLFHPKALTVKMTGSGSACFALFKNENDAQECFNNVKESMPASFLTQLS